MFSGSRPKWYDYHHFIPEDKMRKYNVYSFVFLFYYTNKWVYDRRRMYSVYVTMGMLSTQVNDRPLSGYWYWFLLNCSLNIMKLVHSSCNSCQGFRPVRTFCHFCPVNNPTNGLSNIHLYLFSVASVSQ